MGEDLHMVSSWRCSQGSAVVRLRSCTDQLYIVGLGYGMLLVVLKIGVSTTTLVL